MSWLGLARPSTTDGAGRGKDVDGRHKAGHDAVGDRSRYVSAYGACPGHPPPTVAAQMAGTRPAMTIERRPYPQPAAPFAPAHADTRRLCAPSGDTLWASGLPSRSRHEPLTPPPRSTDPLHRQQRLPGTGPATCPAAMRLAG